MAEFNISDSQTNVYDVKSDKILLLYNNQIQGLPANIIYQNINDLDNIDIENYKHIIIQDLLDFYPETSVTQVLLSIYNKMSLDSKIEIQGIDLKQLCVAVASEDVDETLAKNILFSRKNTNTIYDIQTYLKEVGFKIDTRKYINIFEYNITGIK